MLVSGAEDKIYIPKRDIRGGESRSPIRSKLQIILKKPQRPAEKTKL